jgi:putative transposase
MARPLRIEYPGAVYHIMNRGNSRQKIFLSQEDHHAFLELLDAAHGLWGIEILAYCLMENHYHLCVRTPEDNLPRIMRHVGGIYTQRFNRAHGRDGVLFRGRYKAIVVDADSYLAAVVRYIHLNPVAANLVTTPEAYPWSSHASYVKRMPIPAWLKVDAVLEQFSTITDFQKFVLAGNEDAVEAFYHRHHQGPVLGAEPFRERLRRRLHRIDREHPRHERRPLRPTMEEVLQHVAEAYGVEAGELLRGRRGVENEARKVAIYLVKQLCDLTLRETANGFTVGSYGVVGWACHGVRARMKHDKRFQNKVELIQQNCNQQKI